MQAELVAPDRPEAVARERTSVLAIAGWIGFVLLFLYAVFIGGGWPGIHLVSLRILSLVLIAVTLAGWCILAWRQPAWRPVTAMWPTLVIPPVVLAVATLASQSPRLGLEYVAWAVLLVALYLLLVRIMATTFARERIGALAAMLALVIGLVYIGTVVERWLEWWQLVGGLTAPPLRPLFASLTFGTPNSVLTVMVLLATVAWAGLGWATRGRKVMLTAVGFVTVVVVVMTGSRAGWLAVAGAGLIVGGAWIIDGLRRGSFGRITQDRLQRRHVRLSLTAFLITAFVVALVVAPLVLQRLNSGGDGGRGQYFTVALRMFAEAPVLGTGPGTWAVQRAAYTEPGELDWYIPHAHDLYLQTLAELGIVGFLAGVAALLPVAWLVYRALRGVDPTRRRWAWAAFFVLLYLGLHQLLDFYLNMPTVMLLAAIPVAVLDATSDDRLGLGRRTAHRIGDPASKRLAQAVRALLWISCLASVLVLARTESLAATHEAALAAAYEDDWEAARGPADEAALADPDMTAYQVTRGLVASARHDWPVAADAFGRAARTDDLPQSWLGLAQAQAELGAPIEEVAATIERALRIGSQQPAVVYAAGALYDRIGLADEADEAYGGAVAALPSVAGDPSWTTHADLALRFAGILDRAMELAPGRAWEIALMAGEPKRARTLVEAAGVGTSMAGLIIDAWSGDVDALRELFALADASPTDAELLSWATRMADRNGDEERAERYQRLAIFVVTEGGALPGTEIRVDPDGWFRHVPAGTITGYAGHYLYRRPLPPDLLAPGLPRLVNIERPDRSATGEEG